MIQHDQKRLLWVQLAAQPLLWQHSMQSAMEVVRCNSAIMGAAGMAKHWAGSGIGGGHAEDANPVSSTPFSGCCVALQHGNIWVKTWSSCSKTAVPQRHLQMPLVIPSSDATASVACCRQKRGSSSSSPAHRMRVGWAGSMPHN